MNEDSHEQRMLAKLNVDKQRLAAALAAILDEQEVGARYSRNLDGHARDVLLDAAPEFLPPDDWALRDDEWRPWVIEQLKQPG